MIGRLLRAIVRDVLAATGFRGDHRRNRCTHCGEKHRNMTGHLWFDHADGA